MKKLTLVAVGLFILIYYSSSSAFGFTDSDGNFIGFNFGGEKGNGELVLEAREVESFDKVAVSAGINMILVPSTYEKVTVETDANLQDNIVVKVKDGELIIKVEESIKSSEKMEVTVYFDDIIELDISAGAIAKTNGSIVSDNLDVHVNAGAIGQLECEIGTMSASTSSGAILEMEGKVSTVDYDASSGAQINASNLVAEKVEADASSGAIINLTANTSLDADASSGGLIEYSGNATVEKETSSGGLVSKM